MIFSDPNFQMREMCKYPNNSTALCVPMLAETETCLRFQLRREESGPARALFRQICSLVEGLDAARAATLMGKPMHLHQPALALARLPTYSFPIR